jgi:hypothetical protein
MKINDLKNVFVFKSSKIGDICDVFGQFLKLAPYERTSTLIGIVGP